MPNGWFHLRPSKAGKPNHDYVRTMQVAGDRCEGHPVRIAERCTERATEVVEWFEQGSTTVRRAALCAPCRRKCMGKTSAETRADRQREEVRQIAAFDDGRGALRAWAAIAQEGDPAKLRAYSVAEARTLSQACGVSIAGFDRVIAAAPDAKLCSRVRAEVNRNLKRLEAA